MRGIVLPASAGIEQPEAQMIHLRHTMTIAEAAGRAHACAGLTFWCVL